MVTLEIAIAIPVLLMLAVSLMWLANVGRLEAMAQDSARAAVRELVRGGDRASAQAIALRILPGAEVNSSASGDTAEVIVTMSMNGPAPLLRRFTHRVSARAIGSLESQ